MYCWADWLYWSASTADAAASDAELAAANADTEALGAAGPVFVGAVAATTTSTSEFVASVVVSIRPLNKKKLFILN